VTVDFYLLHFAYELHFYAEGSCDNTKNNEKL